MPTHITARLAWHTDGWNGAICRAPEKNTYCVGCKSYPGDLIQRERNLETEKRLAGCSGDRLEGYVPPCSYSYNAFGLAEAPSASNPPDFFFDGARRHEWALPPATVSVWPYEAMYAEEVKAEGYLDNSKRRELMLEFFQPIEKDCGKNLVFYYANYSNPLSEEEAPHYVLIGVSRIVKVGRELFLRERLGGYWETLRRRHDLGARHKRGLSRQRVCGCPTTATLTNPTASLISRSFPRTRSSASTVPSTSPTTRPLVSWSSSSRRSGSCGKLGTKVRTGTSARFGSSRNISTLWRHRGLYPGLLKALRVAGATPLIGGVKQLAIQEGQERARAAAFEFLESWEGQHPYRWPRRSGAEEDHAELDAAGRWCTPSPARCAAAPGFDVRHDGRRCFGTAG